MASSVSENVPPDRGRTSFDSEMEELSAICLNANNAPSKRPADHPQEIPEKRSAPSLPPSASVQHSYILPGYESQSDLKYTDTDSGPFVVHVAKSENDLSTSSKNMQTFKIAQVIYNGKVSGIQEIKNLGRNKVAIYFKKYSDANAFLCHPLLTVNKLTAVIPRFQVTRMGVVRQIPLDWSLENFVSWIECRSDSTTVIKARRLNRKKRVDGQTIWEPTGTVVLTFLGQKLPSHIYCCSVSTPVDIYTLPTIQCLKCCRFGHVRDQCRSIPRCSRCAGPHEASFCKIGDDKVSCLFCSGLHAASDPNCPEQARQRSIKLLMSEENISYIEAARKYRPVRSSYSNVTNAPPPQHLNYPNPILSKHSVSSAASSSDIHSKQASPSTSYRKTFFIERRPRPDLGKSFDHQAHSKITSSPAPSLPNGCALNAPTNPSPNDNLAELLSMTLVSMFAKFNDILPYKVLEQIQSIITSLIQSYLNKNGESHTVEHS